MRLSLVIPAHRRRNVTTDGVDSALRHLGSRSQDAELIVVDPPLPKPRSWVQSPRGKRASRRRDYARTEAVMKRIAVVIALLCATSAGADALQEWKTPAGKIYFGDRPPEGSVPVKKVQKPIGKVAVPKPPPAAGAEPQAYAWRNEVGCTDLTFTGVK